MGRETRGRRQKEKEFFPLLQPSAATDEERMRGRDTEKSSPERNAINK